MGDLRERVLKMEHELELKMLRSEIEKLELLNKSLEERLSFEMRRHENWESISRHNINWLDTRRTEMLHDNYRLWRENVDLKTQLHNIPTKGIETA